MALHRKEVLKLVQQHRLIPLFNPDDFDVCSNVLKAAYDGGVRVFECTNRSANALDIFKQLVPAIRKSMPDLILGAGTIMDSDAAASFFEAGAQFIVSPVITPEVGDFCHKHDLFWCPGAGSLNEVVNAHNMGADIVKIFPASQLGGPGFVKAIMAPCPWLKIMPTGGVDGTEKNIKAWFESGVTCVGIGSQLFSSELIAAKDYSTIGQRTREIVNIIQSIPKHQAT
jgi:2-dehydro-3-deoxyphosphogluconate aldolase/(4S)-4-hydroxy-2-oxoglutarate aldolase